MFDPAKKREYLESPTMGYRADLRYTEGIIGEKSCARGDSATRDACACHICGLDEGARLLAERGQRVLREAKLSSLNHLNRGHLYRALALGHWLLTGEDDHESLEMSSHEYWVNFNIEGMQPDGHILDYYLPYFLFTHNYEFVCVMYEHFSGGKEPKRLKTVRTSRVAAYAWAQYKLGKDGYGRETAERAAKSFLDKRLGESVLGRGQFENAAIWLKILYWNDIENPPSPRDVLLKAYDHMPEAERPF